MLPLQYIIIYQTIELNNGYKLPNQELSGAKSELQRETVGVRSSYRRVDQLPYNSALRRVQMYLRVHVNKWNTYE